MKAFLLLASSLSAFACANAFDVVALVDSLDFAKTYDVETATGTVQVLEHVLLTHANDIWWRDKGGGKMRYPSQCEAWPISDVYAQLYPTLCDPMDCSLPGSSVHGDSLGKNKRCHALLQGIFLTQELNWGLLHCR